MASVSKRTWKTRKGEQKTGWVLHYVDLSGKQQRKLFKLKRDAEEERIRIEAEIATGEHRPDNESPTVLEAAKQFLADYQNLVDAGKRERSTLRGYEQHINLHIKPFAIAKVKLSRLKGPDCTAFAKRLEENRSDAMARRVFGTLRRVLDFSVSRGWLAVNPAKSVAIRTSGTRHDDGKLEIPSKQQLRSLLVTAEKRPDQGRCYAMVSLLMFAGLRASEMRGLRWIDIDFDARRVKVEQRVDRWQKIGPVKTRNSRRSIPVPLSVIEALRKWRRHCVVEVDGLIFPTGAGRPESYANIYNRLWCPLMKEAGLADVEARDDAVKIQPWFALHMLRHVACSLWIEQSAEPHRVKTWAGHAKIQFTHDVYGHLWHDDATDKAIASAIEKSVVSNN